MQKATELHLLNKEGVFIITKNTFQQGIANEKLEEREKLIALFQFIKELNKIKHKAILNINEYDWKLLLSNIHDDPENIVISYRDRVDAESENLSNVLLSVHKPEFKRCPPPDNLFAAWLEKGWENHHNTVSVRRTIHNYGEEVPECFEDDDLRVNTYNMWLLQRSEWVEKQKILEKTRDLFSDLYRWYFELQKNSETMEIIVANGMLCDRDKPELRHPVLTHRVKLSYDADENIVSIEDTDLPSELYSIAFQMMEDVNLTALNSLSDDLQKNDYHPLDRNDTPAFLKVLVHQLSSDSAFAKEASLYNWQKSNRLFLYMEPCYIVRKRLDGTLKALEQIIEDLADVDEIPAPLGDIVRGGKIEIPEDIGEESVEEQLAAVGGESVDILLSKEANKEQLEIAKRIEYYNAVLVQGPPGTGKTHTIANIMGHFLAQGKSVLVTSHTGKALNVLKDKVASGLQNLCVSILDDSNIDMERSVDGITTYMAKTTSNEVKKEKDRLLIERKKIINDLAETRRKIYAIINKECDCIVYEGEGISPSEAAKFISKNSKTLSYIPGKVKLNYPLPLTFDQLVSLYRSNESLTSKDEEELGYDIPNPEEILNPDEFAKLLDFHQSAIKNLEALEENNGWRINNLREAEQVEFECPFGLFKVAYPQEEALTDLKNYSASFGKIEKWMKCVAVDGKRGGAFRQRWISLIEQIQTTCDYSAKLVSEQFGLEIQISDSIDKTFIQETSKKLKDIFNKKGKISKVTKFFHKEYTTVLENVNINGKQLQSADDCDIIIHCIEMDNIRKKCAAYWDELIAVHDIPKFIDLDDCNQERIASKWIPTIKKYLDWNDSEYQPLLDKLQLSGFPADVIFSSNNLDSELVATDKILSAVEKIVPLLCEACTTVRILEEQAAVIEDIKNILALGERKCSKYCVAVLDAIERNDRHAYYEAYAALSKMYRKYKLQHDRAAMLNLLSPIAPSWAEAIKNRVGIHGEFTVPENIEDAWKWKQLSGLIDEIIAQPFSQLQSNSLLLSKEYRRITALYAEKCAWYNLLKRTETDIDMKQALQGWKLTIKRIGKGTGKNAPILKAKARELMTKCQDAVPGWIMPINKALESLNPKSNRFDVVIIDEASQSDISSLAILYMGRKLIIVGDDKQVSPMAVGVELDKMNALEEMYIKDKIPNSHLYNAKTSIYDIATTTFQPLMLREHFRCVPEIIGFSNMLSYEYKIKPLRDAGSSCLHPAVVGYRVAGGYREERSKINNNEAQAIVALIQACIEQPEYKGKTIGVISLLGDDQVKVIQRLLEQQVDPKEIILRSILCGNSANFQGDERDVIFLSVVDSGDGTGPVRLQNFGTDDAYRKRYNVAASRAKDQLWVVHSFDAAVDLKPGDIRKTLIDYASNPQADAIRRAEIETKAESPFEAAVAVALISRGYHLVQQWQVGAYRLDMVAVCGEKKVAIECDGERWHSGEAKIREDMERQTILERLGWKFIRIRGSEYYCDSESAINRLVKRLEEYNIEPEATSENISLSYDTELLKRVKRRAAIILSEEEPNAFESELTTISAALNGTSTTGEIVEVSTLKSGGKYKLDNQSASENIVGLNSVANRQDKDIILDNPESKLSAVTKTKSMSIRKEKSERTNISKSTYVMSEKNDIILLLKNNGVQYIDKRRSNGALWILGGHELDNIVRNAQSIGYLFRFKPEGGKVTKGKPGWWTK